MRRLQGARRKRRPREVRAAFPPPDRRPRGPATQGGRPGDRPPPGAVQRTFDGQPGARNHAQGLRVRLERAAVAVRHCERNEDPASRPLDYFVATLLAMTLRLSIPSSLARVDDGLCALPCPCRRACAFCACPPQRPRSSGGPHAPAERQVGISGWFFVRPGGATATSCKPLSGGCPRSRVTIGFRAP